MYCNNQIILPLSCIRFFTRSRGCTNNVAAILYGTRGNVAQCEGPSSTDNVGVSDYYHYIGRCPDTISHLSKFFNHEQLRCPHMFRLSGGTITSVLWGTSPHNMAA